MSENLRRGYFSSSPQELRLLLLGNIGCGKSSSANTLLGETAPSLPDASRSCQLRQGVFEGRSLTLVEAPRWYWTGGKMEDSVRKETERAMTLLAPGPHAILLLVPVSQFTEMDGRVPAELEELFDKGALDHTLVLLTCGDYLMGKSVEDYLKKEHPGLRQMIEKCGGRYHVINNRQRQDGQQVQELLEKVENMVHNKGIFHMKSPQEIELEKQVNERKQELMESFRAQKEEEIQTAAYKHSSNTTTRRSIERGEEYSAYLERRRREELEEMDGRVSMREVSNGLHSAERQTFSESFNDRELMRTSSYKLNADGALLSQMSEPNTSPKLVTTLHHRLNSFEGGSSELSPTSSPHSPVFTSTSSSPVFTSTSSSFPLSSSLSQELRLVMLGRSGSGKSAAGNNILGREEFASLPIGSTAITRECEKRRALAEGRRVAVVDTPDWFNTEQSPDEVRAQISSCVALSSPGPHAFLLCVPVDQPAKLELQALATLESVFGPEAVQKHTLVLFTYADRLRQSGVAGNASTEAYIASQREDLLKLVEKCGDRFHVMETKGAGRERRNVAELLEKVEQTVNEAGGQCYSCPAFQEAENRVRQRQEEIARERKRKRLEEERQLNSERRVLYSYMQPVAEAEEEVREDEIEKTRDEAEMSVSTMNIKSLPPVVLSSVSPSYLSSISERVRSIAKSLPKLLSDGSVLVGEGAKKVSSSPVWGTVGSGAQSAQKMVVDSTVWKKVGAGAGHMSKMVGDRVPKVVVDSSAWVGSGAKAAAASPVWGKVGSGAKLVAERSRRVGAGIGSGAKNLAKSPMWGKVGSGAKSGAKLMADGSMRVGAGLGAGAKKVAQSPVWGQVGSGAKAGVKMVADSSVWERIGGKAKQVPKVVIAGALLGLVLGVLLAGAVGGAVGAAAGSAVSEVGRRKFSKKDPLKVDGAAKTLERSVNDNVDSLVKQGGKVLKTE
ncbi:uncharacterized protein LOC122872882 isoform X1 [Xyrichtys novacula]|uniref:Uncharacterized protein LOC122872882 isoform X1 n=1 Tax=Xyrichtys novacula TaxID=13765 RepID=A0AAV1EXP3_XYRNO|nr:uncharacterized protein LOC122872882 isoform X1 [Xyrichtys novacula]